MQNAMYSNYNQAFDPAASSWLSHDGLRPSCTGDSFLPPMPESYETFDTTIGPFADFTAPQSDIESLLWTSLKAQGYSQPSSLPPFDLQAAMPVATLASAPAQPSSAAPSSSTTSADNNTTTTNTTTLATPAIPVVAQVPIRAKVGRKPKVDKAGEPSKVLKNRNAQRKFRENQASRVKTLEDKLRKMTEERDFWMGQCNGQ